MTKRQIVIFAAVLAALLSRAAAQETSPTLTLDDAIRLALQRNKDLKVASFSPKISRANLLVARGAFDPSLVFSRTYNSTDFNTSIGPIPVLDLTKVDYIDSAGIGLLALATGKMKQAGGKLAVVAGPGKVLDMLNLTQMTAVVTVRGTVAEAELTFGESSAEV